MNGYVFLYQLFQQQVVFLECFQCYYNSYLLLLALERKHHMENKWHFEATFAEDATTIDTHL